MNCRKMEERVFYNSAVAEILGPKFVEARLHVDHPNKGKENMQRELEMAGSRAQPVYLVLDPLTEEVHSRQDGASLVSDAPFVEFLQKGWTSARPGQ